MVLQMNNRLAIYREFLSSEHGYIKDLTVLKDVFQTSFVNNLSKKDPLLSEAEIETVFCNVERIIQVHLLLSIHFRFIPNFIWLSKNISPKFVSHNWYHGNSSKRVINSICIQTTAMHTTNRLHFSKHFIEKDQVWRSMLAICLEIPVRRDWICLVIWSSPFKFRWMMIVICSASASTLSSSHDISPIWSQIIRLGLKSIF